MHRDPGAHLPGTTPDIPPCRHRSDGVEGPSSPLGPKPLWLLACVLAALVVGACDETFEPLAPGGVSFSVWGFLDAAADTQWIRVMPLRPTTLSSPELPGATVTLEDLATGQLVTLRDSLLWFEDFEGASQGLYAHDFWTTETVDVGATYRFSAERDGQGPAEALVELPDDYEVEVWISQGTGGSDYLRLTGLEHLAFVLGVAHLRDQCGPDSRIVPYERRPDPDDGILTIPIVPVPVASNPDRVLECGRPEVEKQELRILAAAATWPEGVGYAPGALGEAPKLASNVTNALGFLGGVLTKSAYYEGCELAGTAEGMPVPDYCRLRYDRESATLTGSVVETRCGEGAIAQVPVELRELDGEPPELRKIRPTVTNRFGTFTIGGLVAGIRYGFEVRVPPLTGPGGEEIDHYTVYADTLELGPGERRTVEVQLQRRTACGGAP